MSDCSTDAMKPKEPPKTCGKCGDLEPACNFMWARMQELEQVAREMLRYLIRYETKAGNPFDSGCHLVSDGYRDHLEALGVSIDD